MKIIKHIVSLSEDEVNLLLEGLCKYIESDMFVYKDFKQYKQFSEKELDLLNELSAITPLFFWAGNGVRDAKQMTDAYEWAEARYKQLQNEKNATKK